MLERRLLVFVPAVATLVTAFALFGPARERAVFGARVFVADDSHDAVRSLRIQIVERVQGIEEPRALRGLTVRAGGNEAWHGSSGSDGVVEVALPDAASGPLEVRVESGTTVLASGVVESRVATVNPSSSFVPGAAQGNVHVTVEVPRGQLTPPFPEKVRISAKLPEGQPMIGLAHVAVTGADIDREALSLDERGTATVEVKPLAQSAEIEVRVEGAGALSGTFAGSLPVGIGSIWLSETSTRSHLVFAVRSPHRAAYVSLYDDRGRFGGLVVPLEAGADGFYRGEADVPASTGPLVAVVATDPQERGLTTVSWPVDPPERPGSYDHLRRALDGVPAADAAERTRLSRARRIISVFLGSATLLEIALLLLEWRRTRKHLRRHFDASSSRAADGEERVDTSRLVASQSSTALVVGAVAAILLLAAATLVALDFAAGGL